MKKLINVEDNFILLPAETIIQGINFENISPEVKYIVTEEKQHNNKLFLLTTIMKTYISNNSKNLVLSDLDGELPYVTATETQSILEVQLSGINYALIIDSNGQVVAVTDNLIEKQRWRLFEEVVMNFQEEIFVTDNYGKVLFVNPKGAEILGLTPEEMQGSFVHELVEKGIISRSGSLAVLEEEKKVDILQFLSENNKWRLCTGIPVCNYEGSIIMAMCTSKDVTELVETKRELENTVGELRKKDREINNVQEELFAQVNFVAKSPQMKKIKDTIKKIAPLDLTVLILGDTGVGKEVVARSIHALSPRREGNFIKINCAALPEHLIETELFGYEKGAFTGADKKGKKGKVELADGGTLFLDEIGEVSQDFQAKLLEFLQDMEFYQVGGNKKLKINTRIIAATNCNLHEEIKKGNFRKDLFYRLNLIPITIPQLRERRDDILVLINYFLDLYNRKYEKNVVLSDNVVETLISYDWPGNVRELEHVLERLVVMSEFILGNEENLHNLIIEAQDTKEEVYCSTIIPYKRAKRKLERELVQKAYHVYGSTYKAAEVLDVSQSTVVRILKRLGEGNEYD